MTKTLFRAALTTALAAGMLAAQTATDLRVAAAAMQGDRNGVRDLIRQKADVNAAQGDGMTALHWAAQKDDLDLAKMLLAAGANVKAATRDAGITPLFLACSNGDAELIDAFLKAGADVNSAKQDGTTPLMTAAASGSVDAVKLMLNHGANVNAIEEAHGQTAVMFAAALGRDAVVRVLAANGADLKIQSKVAKLIKMRYDEDGNPIAPAAAPPAGAAAGGRGGRGGASTANRASLSAMGGNTALLYAARDGHLESVKGLVEAGADVNEVSAGDKTSPIVMAVTNGHYDVGKYLLDHGANPNLANEQGLAALYATIDAQYAPLGWAPNPITVQEKTSHLELMKALLAHGANPNTKLGQKLWFRPLTHDQQWINPTGATPFWRAAVATDLAAMKILIAGGADPNIPSDGGDTPLMMAAGIGWAGNFTITVPDSWVDAVKYCVDLGSDINAADKQGYTPLMGAAWRGNNELIQYMVDKGAKVTARNQRGWSVTDMANGPSLRSSYSRTYPESIALLLKLGAPELTAAVGEPVLGVVKKKPAAPATKDNSNKESTNKDR